MEIILIRGSSSKCKWHLFLSFILEVRVIYEFWISLLLLDIAEVNHSIERNNLVHMVNTYLEILKFVKVVRLHIPSLLSEGYILLKLLR